MNTKALRQKILDLAIHGKLVPQDPNDEPASVLLERIRAEKERLIKEGKIKRPKKSKTTSDKPHYENVPFEVPSSWVWTTLGEIAEIITGNTPSKDIKEYYSGNIPFFKPTDLEQGIHTKYSKDRLTPLGFEQSRKLPANSVLVTCIGATIGKTGLTTVEGTCNQQINAIIPTFAILAKFLFYVCISDYMQHEIKANASATTLPILNKGNFSKIAITVPPLQEQSRIVKSIEHWLSLVDCIEGNKENLLRTIREAKSKVLDLAIHGKLVHQDPTDEPASELLKRINPKAEITSDNGHYQKLPEGWCITSISEMCENINGLWKGKKEPFVKVGVIRNANFTKDFKLDYSKIEYIDVEERAFKKRHLLNGDLIVEKSGGSDNNPVGRAILYEGKDAIFSFSNFTMVLRIHYKDVLSYKYLYYYIMSKYQKGEMRLMQTQTTGLHNLILDKYLDIPLCLPPYQEQQRIINKIEETFGVLDLIMKNL